MLPLLLVAGSLGMSNFAASIAIGLSGVDQSLRTRVAVIFGLFEAGMPVIGLLLGRQISHTLGAHAHLIGGLLLVAAGTYTVIAASRSRDKESSAAAGGGLGGLLLLAAGLSIDNLIVGFALGAYHAPLVLGIAVIAAVSVALSLIGLELGARLGAGAEHRSELLGGVVLICVGVAIATRML